MDGASWIAAGTLVTAILGLTIVGGQLREQRRAMRAQFDNLYIERYWQIDDALLFERKDTERHRQHQHRYLRLFEDEFDVARLGFLDSKQWQTWHSVLDDGKLLGLVRKDLVACNPDGDEFLRLRTCINQRLGEAATHAAKNCRGNSVTQRPFHAAFKEVDPTEA